MAYAHRLPILVAKILATKFGFVPDYSWKSLVRFNFPVMAVKTWQLWHPLMQCVIRVSGLMLTHWGRVTHICVSKLTIIGSDNGLSPGRRQAIIWTNAGILLIGPLGTNFNETSIEIHTFSLKKIHLKLSSGKWRSFCLGLNMLSVIRHPCCIVRPEVSVLMWSVTAVNHVASCHQGSLG